MRQRRLGNDSKIELRMNSITLFIVFSVTSSKGSLPFIFCIHMRWGPIYWGGGVIYLAKKIIR